MQWLFLILLVLPLATALSEPNRLERLENQVRNQYGCCADVAELSAVVNRLRDIQTEKVPQFSRVQRDLSEVKESVWNNTDGRLRMDGQLNTLIVRVDRLEKEIEINRQRWWVLASAVMIYILRHMIGYGPPSEKYLRRSQEDTK